MTPPDAATVTEPKPAGHRRTPTDARIAGFWVTVADAAAALDVSERTVRRRISSGTIPSRTWNGIRQVRLDPPDHVPMPDTTPDDAGHADGHDGHRHPDGTLTTIDHPAALAALLQRVGDLAELQARDAQDEARRARRHARLAWAAAAALVAVAASVAVQSRENALRASADLERVQGRLDAETSHRASYGLSTDAALAELHRQLLEARTAAAVAEHDAHRLRVDLLTAPGRMTANQDATIPTTSPHSLIDLD